MDLSVAFILYFLHGLYLVGPLLILMLAIILVLGQIAGRIESWSKFDAVYWSLITAMTIGYGDIRPVKNSSRSLSLIIGFIGLVLTGITVTVAIQAGTKAFDEYADYTEETKNTIDKEINLMNQRIEQFEDKFAE
jgi:voltage-gated potassium channel